MDASYLVYYHTKELQGLIYWVEDTPAVASKLPMEQMLTQVDLVIAAASNDICNNLSDNMETVSRAADAGKLQQYQVIYMESWVYSLFKYYSWWYQNTIVICCTRI